MVRHRAEREPHGSGQSVSAASPAASPLISNSPNSRMENKDFRGSCAIRKLSPTCSLLCDLEPASVPL